MGLARRRPRRRRTRGRAAPPRPGRAAALPAAGEAGFAQWRGVASCTSSGCHNQDSGRSTYARGSEYAVWSAHDPHSRAFQVLFDARSLQIQKNLVHAVPPNAATTPDKNLLCIRCHVDPHADSVAEAAPVWFGDGVGCESCHGPAGGWLTAHFGPAWKGMSDEEKCKRGFNDMKDLQNRARACTDCHVGGDRAEVNHDLIAAGHPALLFENSSFLDRYRPYQHWSEAEDRRRHPAFEAEAWAVGQAVSAEAALKLLKSRASGEKPWPEFAEYDCASCHQTVKPRITEADVSHPLGVPAWSWYASMTPFLPDARPDHGEPTSLLKQLRDEMEKSNPNRAVVAEKAEAYREWLSRRPAEGTATPDLRGELLRLTGGNLADHGWEEARQRSFAVSAYYRSLEAVGSGRADARTAALAAGLVEALRPPPGLDAPRSFDAARVREYLEHIHDRLTNH